MDNGCSVEVVSLAEFQGRECVAKAGRLFQIGCPFIHISEEQTGFYIFQDRFHLAFRNPVGLLIFANCAHRARRAPMKGYSCNQEKNEAEFPELSENPSGGILVAGHLRLQVLDRIKLLLCANEFRE
jgi:hypothetical protein